MTPEQKRTIDLLYELGSNKEITYQDGRNYRVALPFCEDRNPNIEVFPDGHYTDYSASPEWEKLGIGKYGDSHDLMMALGKFKMVTKERLLKDMQESWDKLETLFSDMVLTYTNERHLWGHIRWGYLNARIFIAFPMWKDGAIVGIQRRFIDGEQPKNMMYKGSDSHGVFRTYEELGEVIYVMEGATDAATDCQLDGDIIGAPSASMLEGVQEYIAQKERDGLAPDSRICLCFDNDTAGREATRKMVEWLHNDGEHEILILDHPAGTKDFNDIIVAGYTPTFHGYKEEHQQISFIDYREPIDKIALGWGIVTQFGPNLIAYCQPEDDGSLVTVYVAESVGLQNIYRDAVQNEKVDYVIVRGI